MSTAGTSTTATYQVRRTLDDILWLHNTLLAHKKLGGTLCGRILPPFQDSTSRILSESVSRDSSSSSLLWQMMGSRDTSFSTTTSTASSNSTGLWSYCKIFWKIIQRHYSSHKFCHSKLPHSWKKYNRFYFYPKLKTSTPGTISQLPTEPLGI